jgi:hypothetical protein
LVTDLLITRFFSLSIAIKLNSFVFIIFKFRLFVINYNSIPSVLIGKMRVETPKSEKRLKRKLVDEQTIGNESPEVLSSGLKRNKQQFEAGTNMKDISPEIELPAVTAPIEEEEEEEEYIVEAILDLRKKGARVEYLIKWSGWPDSSNTWEPEANLNCNDLVEDFKRKHAKKAKEETVSAKKNKKVKSRKFLDSDESEDLPVKKTPKKRSEVAKEETKEETREVTKEVTQEVDKEETKKEEVVYETVKLTKEAETEKATKIPNEPPKESIKVAEDPIEVTKPLKETSKKSKEPSKKAEESVTVSSNGEAETTTEPSVKENGKTTIIEAPSVAVILAQKDNDTTSVQSPQKKTKVDAKESTDVPKAKSAKKTNNNVTKNGKKSNSNDKKAANVAVTREESDDQSDSKVDENEPSMIESMNSIKSKISEVIQLQDALNVSAADLSVVTVVRSKGDMLAVLYSVRDKTKFAVPISVAYKQLLKKMLRFYEDNIKCDQVNCE